MEEEVQNPEVQGDVVENDETGTDMPAEGDVAPVVAPEEEGAEEGAE